MGLNVDLNAVAKAKVLLGKSRHQPANIPALHWSEVLEFYKSISENTFTNLALRLLILTGVRCFALCHIQVNQIDDQIWTVPGQNRKGQVANVSDFRAALSDQARDIIKLALPFESDGYLFPGIRRG